MTRILSRSFLVAGLVAFLAAASAHAGNWPQWRGPTGDGVSAETGLPLKWSNDSNILWKSPLDGLRLQFAHRLGRRRVSYDARGR